ncbi:MAG TPA: bifunctional hydroxymethylpyrimidine kinase/phosphomethylpyrimidine kinase, partial [Burkholderiaceae bacterium]|nr:bifunctional hydroxymethylpyrimidine kinase/phosphomethylpyrimidine kinase [Burkholderiaceae bacterium]
MAADQRTADAFGVHLCPVVVGITAQDAHTATHAEPLRVERLDAQFDALAADKPPCVVKTGRLGDAAQVRCVARWIDRLRERAPVSLVVDPVLDAGCGGAPFADDATVNAYRDELL